MQDTGKEMREQREKSVAAGYAIYGLSEAHFAKLMPSLEDSRYNVRFDLKEGLWKDFVALSFEVPHADVELHYDYADMPSLTQYTLILNCDSYRVSCLREGEEEGELEEVFFTMHREELLYACTKLAKLSGQTRQMLQRLSLDGLGQGDKQHAFREVSFFSSLIRPGAYLVFLCWEDDIHWVPEHEDLSDGTFRELPYLLPYVNVSLSLQWYDVRYKDKQTQWKEVHERVSASRLVEDYGVTMRAALDHMSPEQYVKLHEANRAGLGFLLE